MYLIEGTVQTRALSAPVLEPLKGRDTTVRVPEKKMVPGAASVSTVGMPVKLKTDRKPQFLIARN